MRYEDYELSTAEHFSSPNIFWSRFILHHVSAAGLRSPEKVSCCAEYLWWTWLPAGYQYFQGEWVSSAKPFCAFDSSSLFQQVYQSNKLWLQNHFKMSHFTHFDVFRRFRNFYFFAYSSMIFDLFCAVKTMLIKIENLWYLLSKKVNFDAQHWLHCTKKVKIQRQIGEKN